MSKSSAFAGTASRPPQDHAAATSFGGRKPADGEIDWNKSATEVRNLVRAVTRPYPGAFSFLGDRKCFFWSVKVVPNAAGAALALSPLCVGVLSRRGADGG